MSIKARFLKGGAQIALGQVLQQLMLLVRNILIARLLPPEQFGIALTLVTVMYAFDAVSEIGIDKFFIRSIETNDVSLQQTLHSIQIVRGLISALIMFCLAQPIAILFGAPDTTWVFRGLALVPLVRGFAHLDIRRYERELKFWPNTISNLIATFVGLLTAVSLASLWQSYDAALAGLLAQTLIMTIASHVLSERSYRLNYDRSYSQKLFRFGAPLIGNGILLFASMQLDRIIVGSMLSIRDLANYGIVALLANGLSQMVLRVVGTLYLPLLVGSHPGESRYDRRFELCGAISSFLALSVVIVFGIVGQGLIAWLYGPSYDISRSVVFLLGLQAGIKIQRSWLQVGFMAVGRTNMLLIANVVATLGMGIGAIAVAAGLGLTGLAACLALGEAAAALASIGLQRNIGTRAFRSSFSYFLLLLLMAAMVWGMRFGVGSGQSQISEVVVMMPMLLMGAGGIVLISRHVRSAAMDLLRKLA